MTRLLIRGARPLDIGATRCGPRGEALTLGSHPLPLNHNKFYEAFPVCTNEAGCCNGDGLRAAWV
jgi:hypothetical protein